MKFKIVVYVFRTGSITNVIPGDFNGDGHLDVLVAYTQPRRKDETFVKVFLGKKSSFGMKQLIVSLYFLIYILMNIIYTHIYLCILKKF